MWTRTAKGVRGRSRRLAQSVVVLCFFSVFAIPGTCCAQVTLASAIRLSLKNSSRVRAAQLDLRKAQENLSVAKDIFVPSVVLGGGAGWTYGITLTVPTIFTVSAQSLVYSNQQRFAIRAAHADLEAAELALLEAQQQTEEDAAITFLSLEENRSSFVALSEQHDFAAKLAAILEDRAQAGLDSELDLDKARREALQIELQQTQAEDDRASLQSHLGELTGLPPDKVTLAAAPIPEIPNAHIPADSIGREPFVSSGVSAAKATTAGKLDHARSDAGYLWRPIIAFNAQYGRISPINNVSSFYNLHNNYNTVNIGVQFSFPILDRVRSDAARESAAEASRAAIDDANLHAQELDGEQKLQRSVRVSAIRLQIAELDYAIAQDELKSTTIKVHAFDGSPPLTPKEEQNARIQERQKYLDLLDARLQLNKAKISLLRQSGQLDSWIHSLLSLSTGP